MAALLLTLGTALGGGAAAGAAGATAAGATAATTIAQVAQIGGTVLGGLGAISAGNSQNAAAEYTARQLEQQGKTEQAIAAKDAQEERRKKDIAISRARAVGAAGGGGQDWDLIGDLEEEGESNALMAIWEGDERAAGRTQQAASARFEGGQAKKAGFLKGGTTLLAGTTSFFDKYG